MHILSTHLQLYHGCLANKLLIGKLRLLCGSPLCLLAELDEPAQGEERLHKLCDES